MDIYIYTVHDDPRTLNKNLGDGLTVAGTIRDETCSLTAPVLTVSGNIGAANYMYIPDFGRYYYIAEQETVRTGIHRITGRVDVLMSFREQILQCPAVLDRSANIVNAFIPDERQPQTAFPVSSLYTFDFSIPPNQVPPITYAPGNIVLITAG